MINRLVFVILLCLSFWACAELVGVFLSFESRWPELFTNAEVLMYGIAIFIIPFTVLYCIAAWVCQEKKGTVTP